jgi:hypothetical protein
LWPTGTQERVEAGETMPVHASASTQQDARNVETVPAPQPDAITRRVGPGAINAGGVYDLEIPQAPRMPFSLRPRTSQRNRFRAEVLVEWVKLNASDPRCQ